METSSNRSEEWVQMPDSAKEMKLLDHEYICLPSDDSLRQFHQAGWSIGDVAFRDGPRGLIWLAWLVSRSNGENLIRAEGSTRDEAWAGAVEQARALGILGR
jgi:hypothetical protein